MQNYIIIKTREIRDRLLKNSGIKNTIPVPIYLTDESASEYSSISIRKENSAKFDGFKIYNSDGLKAAINRIQKVGKVSNRVRPSMARKLDPIGNGPTSAYTGTHFFKIDPGTSAYQEYILRADTCFSEIKFQALNSSKADKIDIEVTTLNDLVTATPVIAYYPLEAVEVVDFEPIHCYEGQVIKITYNNRGSSAVDLKANCKLQTI